jgi:predicted ATPase/DNA-binding CsgD family transcriptional regulator
MGQLALASDSPSCLPAELTAFVGRRQERADVRRRLSQSRLVTLTGFGGVGKTRLAIRVATEVRRVFPNGVWFVPLGELSDPGLLPETIATVLGIHDQSHPLGVIQLSEYLRRRDLLLVLDNCEHLIDTCAVLVDSLLRACPRLRVLATSREALRIEGEEVRPVDPLSVPRDTAGVDTAPEYEGIRLFRERASQAVPGFIVNDENRSAVLGICQHLEGIPLALELAAVRMRAMSPDELLERLQEHWELLDLGSRGAPERHRTMTACLEWSYALCSPEERELWAQLSVFNGGMEMDAIQYVAAPASSSGTSEHLADLVQSLVDKSILTSELTGGRARYRMLETLRRFGRARLESSSKQQATALLRHRDFYSDLVSRIDADWMSPRQVEGLLRLRREEANLRIALEYCCTEPGQGATGLALVSRLRKYALAYGWFSEGRTWLHRLLPLVPEPSMTRFLGLRAACWLASQQGARDDAASLLGEARQLADVLGSTAVGLAEQTSGRFHVLLGDFPAAIRSFEIALRHLRATENPNDVAQTYHLLGQAWAFAGDLERANAAHQACQDICRSAGESWCLSYSLWHLGLVVWTRGESSRAAELVKDSLRLKRQMEERFGVALCLEALAWIRSEEEPRKAATLLGATDALWNSMGTSLEVNPGLFPFRQTSEAGVRASLGRQGYDDAYAQGLAMTTSTAIALALGEKTAPLRPVDDMTESELSALTKREREVAELVAAGLSNKDIASKLVISPRTAEAHVENILTKLGFTTRAQVAAWISVRAGDAVRGENS